MIFQQADCLSIEHYTTRCMLFCRYCEIIRLSHHLTKEKIVSSWFPFWVSSLRFCHHYIRSSPATFTPLASMTATPPPAFSLRLSPPPQSVSLFQLFAPSQFNPFLPNEEPQTETELASYGCFAVDSNPCCLSSDATTSAHFCR